MQNRIVSVQNRVQLQLPRALMLGPGDRYTCMKERGSIWVSPAGKPPKLRFEPGEFICLEKQLYEVIYCFRVRANPREWLYACERRTSLSECQSQDSLYDQISAAGAGSETPRIVREIFRDEMQAFSFFSDIPIGRDRTTFSNKKLVQGAKLVSSGSVS